MIESRLLLTQMQSSNNDPDKSHFQRLRWMPDRMLLDDLVFRLQHAKEDKSWDLGNECFVFYKDKPLVDQYAQFFSFRPEFTARNIFELGMWDGGSIVFWFEFLKPEKHVGIDFTQRTDNPYFQRFVHSRGVQSRISTFWGVDQSDAPKLIEICKREFAGPLDLVIDDASHDYRLTKISFETLFPLMRPGGLYIIEDWAWSHWPEFHKPDSPFANSIPLTRLINGLTATVGTASDLVANVTIFQGFVVVERGPHVFAGAEDRVRFKLENHIINRPEPTFAQRAVRSAKRRARGLLGR